MLRCNRSYAVLVAFIVMLLFLASGCIPQAGIGQGMKSITEMTPKERATWFLGIYNSQARDYKEMVKRPNLTNEQKQMLRDKKEVAKKVWPLINTYRSYVDSGAVPTKEVESQIIGLINDLTALAFPKIE